MLAYRKIIVFNVKDLFIRLDWQGLAEYQGDAKFIRVVGNAVSSEAGDCVTAIAKFRAVSDAFVISNAVKVEGIADNSDLPAEFEATKSFDVMEFINSNLDDAQRAAVVKLMAVR